PTSIHQLSFNLATHKRERNRGIIGQLERIPVNLSTQSKACKGSLKIGLAASKILFDKGSF
ncbi:hypothetical protein EMCG_07632, partial [[Emmonsia] crescens]